MSMMDFAETKKAIDAITTDWSIRGPYHEDDGKYYALLRGEWVGGGYIEPPRESWRLNSLRKR